MGKAIIIPSVNWGTKNLGQVTRLNGLVITGASTTHGEDVVLTSTYNGNPVTAQWSVTSNNATIAVSGSTCTVTPTGTAPATITVQAAYAGSTATKTVSLVETQQITDIDGQAWLDENAITLTAKNSGTTVSDATFAITDGSDLATITDNGNGTATLTAKTTGTGGLVTITASKDGDTVTKQVRVYVMSGMLLHLDGADFANNNWTDRKAGKSFPMTDCTLNANNDGVVFNGTSSHGGSLHNQGTFGNIELSSAGTFEFAVKSAVFSEAMFQPILILPSYIGNKKTVHCSYRTSSDKMVMFSNTANVAFETDYSTAELSGSTIVQSASFQTSLCNGAVKAAGTYTNAQNGDSAILGWNSASSYFKGEMYQIRIYGSNLTADQMLNNQKIDAIRYNITLNINS